MADNLIITKELMDDHWLVTAELAVSGTLPSDIFLYLNSGTDALGDFFGVCSVNDLTRLKSYTGTAINIFGNKYLKHHQAKIKVTLEDDVQAVITALVNNVKKLSLAYASKITSTQSFPIP